MTKSFKKTWLQISVHDLMNRPGESRTIDIHQTLPEDWVSGPTKVPAGSELVITANLESVHEGILVSGGVDFEAVAECSICLKELKLTFQVDFQELFAYYIADGFDYEVQSEHVDIEPIVRDAVVLSLPFQPKCEPECESVEVPEGITLVLAGQERPVEPDPRWAPLAGLIPDDIDKV